MPFVFTDYMRDAIRISALCEVGVIYVMTHDSIGLQEDGPTHQPIEHLASFVLLMVTKLLDHTKLLWLTGRDPQLLHFVGKS